jgi:hypothetical protein
MKLPIISVSTVAVALLFSNCAPYKLPEGYSGPTASIRSTGKALNSVKGEGYYILEINGKFAQHSPMATPYGAGMGLMLSDRTLQVPCEPLDLKLSGGNIYAADGVALADTMIGGSHQVTGNVTFTPKPNAEYLVTGVCGKDRTAVWIVDSKTGKAVSNKVEKN